MTKARDLANSAAAFASVSATELGYVDGVTSAIQTQIDTKAPSSTAVTLTGTQTLTNKTLTSPALTTPTISTATTNGDILYGTGSGALTRLGIGTTGQVLNVASGVPAWATASSGALTKISTQTFSGVSTVTFDSQFTSTYKLYFVSATKLVTTSPYAGVTFRFRKGGVTTTASYNGSQEYLPVNYSGYAPANTFNNNTANLYFIGTDNRAGNATMHITNVGTGGGAEPCMWGTGFTGSSQGYQIFAGMNFSGTTDFDGFILDVSGCNMSGTVTVYGVQA